MSEDTDSSVGILLKRLAKALPGADLKHERVGSEHRFLIAFGGCKHLLPLSANWFEAQSEAALTEVAQTIANRLRATVELLYESA